MTTLVLRKSSLALLLLFAVGIGNSVTQSAPAAPHRLAQHLQADPTGTDPEPPPPCCSLVAVH